MPRFFFDIHDGEMMTEDKDGVQLTDLEAVRTAAISVLPDIARDELPDGDAREFIVWVRDESDQRIFKASLTLQASFLT